MKPSDRVYLVYGIDSRANCNGNDIYCDGNLLHKLRKSHDSIDIFLKIWYYGKVLMIEDLRCHCSNHSCNAENQNSGCKKDDFVKGSYR